MDRTPEGQVPFAPADSDTFHGSRSDTARRTETQPNLFDMIDAVSRRADFLVALTEGPKHKPVLQSELGFSRSTVYKAIRELEELSLVERTKEGYQPSLLGRLLLDQYDQFCSNIEDLCRPAELLSLLPTDCSVSVDFLNGAEAIYAEPHAPHYPLLAFEEVVDEMATLYGMSPVVLPGFVELFHEQISSNGLDAELILGNPVVDCLNENYSDQLGEALETDRLTVFETVESIHYGLAFSDDPVIRVVVLVYDSHGNLHGIMKNDTERSLAWAREVWEATKCQAVDINARLRNHYDSQ